MTLARHQEQRDYAFVPAEKTEQFERIATTIYKEAAKYTKGIPVLGVFHIFEEDLYGISEALFDFAQDIHFTIIEKSGVYASGKMENWTNEEWQDAQEDLSGYYPFLKMYLLDDLTTHWSFNQLVYINEHRTVTVDVQLENPCLQEVW